MSVLTVTPLSAQGDQGRWELINNGLTNLAVAALAIDPVNPDRIFAGTIGGGFFKSTDGGARWSNVGLNVRFGTALAINPVSPNVIYAGTAREASAMPFALCSQVLTAERTGPTREAWSTVTSAL
jgi:hypothetical protein